MRSLITTITLILSLGIFSPAATHAQVDLSTNNEMTPLRKASVALMITSGIGIATACVLVLTLPRDETANPSLLGHYPHKSPGHEIVLTLGIGSPLIGLVGLILLGFDSAGSEKSPPSTAPDRTQMMLNINI